MTVRIRLREEVCSNCDSPCPLYLNRDRPAFCPMRPRYVTNDREYLTPPICRNYEIARMEVQPARQTTHLEFVSV